MLNTNSVILLLECASHRTQVHRKKTLFGCSHWQMTTANSYIDISDYSMRLSMISNSLLITVISTFLYMSFQSVRQGSKHANMLKNRRPCCTAAVFHIHKPAALQHYPQFTYFKKHNCCESHSYGWRGDFLDVSSNMRACDKHLPP